MYTTTKRTRSFDLDRESDLAAYDEVLNNKLCKIITERQIKKTLREYGEEGHIISSEDRIILVVTWEEKELA
jgi:hypothetical protein